MKKAIIFGSSKGIGKSIKQELSKINLKLVCPSSKEVDTKDVFLINQFIQKEIKTDILILNTGGPPAKNFFKITEEEWHIYFKQIFLNFTLLLQRLKINKNGYIFLISSHTVLSPENNLVLSNAYRAALSSVFKTVSKIYAEKNITCINIAPGPFKTKRLYRLVENMKKFEQTLPMKRAGDPKEIGKFIRLIVQNEIKYATGVTIKFDGGLSNYIF